VPIVPERDASIVLRDQYGAEYCSRVVGSSETTLLLRQPDDLPDVMPGARLLVIWPDRIAVWVLPVLVAPNGDGVWQAVIAGEPWREERRQFRRSVVNASVKLSYRYDDSALSAQGPVIDLSEAALRCAVDRDHRGLRVPRTPVSVELTFATDRFTMSGYVLSGRPAARPDLRLEVVVLFDRPVARVDELRRYLNH
jgi:hypothetical protein